jgi:tetratricopeptide (TPR) repeat protein
MADDFKYDVFISYSSANKDWVRKDLLSALEKAGLKVCIDFRDFQVGKPAIKNMRDSILESRHTLLVLTEAYLNSGWADFENMLSQTIDPANRKTRIVPMLKEKCKLPLEIGHLTYVNFLDPDDWDIAWKQLFDSLGKPATFNVKPATQKWFFGHRYGDIENFTGRTSELKMLTDWLNNDKDNLLILRALGGFGKSILTWQWFNNHVDKTKWQTAVWWSFYEKESGFESFLSETLKHLGVEVKESARQQVNDLLEALRGTNILIVLDGFERLLRQYGKMDAALQSDDEDADIDPSQRDCSSPLTETFLRGLSGAGMRSKVLMTTRLCPRALESADGKLLKGCRDEALSAFSPEDAVTYFHNEGIAATRAEIIAACSAYGYHPLSLSLLVGLINEDHEKRGDIEVVKNLEIFEDVRARRHHVLERAYESLAPERRDLLSKISCFRGSMEYAVLKKVFPSADLDKALLDLRKRGLLQYAGESQRYDMHPIVRHYAYDKFAAPDKTDAHTRLVNYFEAVPKPQTVTTLEDLAPVIELYHHMVRAGNLDEACDLFYDRISKPTFYQFGAYQLRIELLRALFLDGEDKPPRLKKEGDQAWTLNGLANSYALSGQPRRAVPLFEMTNDIYENKTKNKKHLAIGLGNVVYQQLSVGALTEAERNARRGISLDQEIQDFGWEAENHRFFGEILCYRGKWDEAEQEFVSAFTLFEKEKDIQMQGVTCSYRAVRFLLMARATQKSSIQNLKSAIASASRALELADEDTKQRYTHPRDYIRAYWLLGSAYLMNIELTLAEENLSKALNLCRQINMVDHEADILLDLARLRYAQGDFKDAQEKASEALMITERSGYVLQGADVNLFLAELTLAEIREKRLESSRGKELARKYAQEALLLATCDGPPYYYKVAYEEAERMLARLSP